MVVAMSKRTRIGIAVMTLGIVLLILGVVKFQSREEVFRFGNIQATASTEKTIPALRYLGIAVTAAGTVLVVLGFTEKDRK